MAGDIQVPEGARFSCQSCGRCCTGWAVPVDQVTADRLRARDWGGDPFIAAAGGSEPFQIRLVEGRCFFLDKDNRFPSGQVCLSDQSCQKSDNCQCDGSGHIKFRNLVVTRQGGKRSE